MTLGLQHLQHVKVPVTDVERSGRWYAALFELDLAAEFTEQGVVRGVALRHRSGGLIIALRDREAIPTRPDLRGFDPFAIGVRDREVLQELVRRCATMGIAHGDIEDRPDGSALDIPDPDGTVVRCYHYTGDERRFTGVAFHADGTVELYDTPRLDI